MTLETGEALSLKEASELIGVPKPTLSRHRKQGKFSAEMIDRAYYVQKSELARAYPKEWRLSQLETSNRSNLDRLESPKYTEKDKEIILLKEALKAKDENLSDLREQLRLVNARLEKHTPKRTGLIARIFG